MHITRAGEYGVLGVLYLARQPQGRVVMIEEISKAVGIPQSFLAKIFQQLTKAAVVASHRGAAGGFTLARSANKIGVLEVLEAIEGPLMLQSCLGESPECIVAKDKPDVCALRALFARARGKFIKELARTTIEDLKDHRASTATKPPKNCQRHASRRRR